MSEKPEDDRQSDAPTAPELPEDEADLPQTGRYMLSREVRGWAVGMAALVVAFAAVAPSMDLGNLAGAAINVREAGSLVKAVADDPGSLTCTAEDQTGGLGGQHVKCQFQCENAPGTVSVLVDADDNDAQVAGTASCGDGLAHCSGKNSCSSTDARKTGGAGSCSGESDEAVDSGLYVECSSSTDNIPGPTGPGEEWCPVTEPEQVCIQPACYQLDAGLRASCQTVWGRLAATLTPTTLKLGALVTNDGGAGLLCDGYVCTPFAITTAT